MNVMTTLPHRPAQQPPTNFIDNLMRITREYDQLAKHLQASVQASTPWPRDTESTTFAEAQAKVRAFMMPQVPVMYEPPRKCYMLDVGEPPDNYLDQIRGGHCSPLGWVPHEEVRRIVTAADMSKPAYGQGAWNQAPSRIFSRLCAIEPVLRDLRRELLSSVRVWPRCRQHDVDCTVFYRRTQLQGDPLIYAAFACDQCLVSQPCPWNGKFHRDASTL